MPSNNRCSVELLLRPSVLDMITNLRVFNDDQHIIELLTNDKAFKGAIIDDEEHQAELKFDNFIPKGVRTLERMFDLNEKFRRPANVKTHSSSLQFELINLGTETEPKYVIWESVAPQLKGISSSFFSSNTKIFFPRRMKI